MRRLVVTRERFFQVFGVLKFDGASEKFAGLRQFVFRDDAVAAAGNSAGPGDGRNGVGANVSAQRGHSYRGPCHTSNQARKQTERKAAHLPDFTSPGRV